jgi:hypothetical protein
MARSSLLKLSRQGLSLRTEILLSLAHGILAAPGIHHPNLDPRGRDASISGLATNVGGVLLTRDGDNCTSRSMGSQGIPAWEIQDFTFDRFWNADVTPSEFRDEVDFVYNNTAFGSRPLHCHDLGTRSNPRLDGTKMQRCDSGSRDLAHFSFDYSSMTLTLTQSWGCDASDRNHA